MSTVRIAIVLALVAGIGGGFQAAMAGSLGRRIGVLESAAILAFLGAILLVAAALAVRGSGGILEGAGQPSWLWLAGPLGALVVFTFAFAPPAIGTFATVGLLIAGQLAAAAIIDALGLVGLERVPLTAARLAGLGFLAVGAALVLRR